MINYYYELDNNVTIFGHTGVKYLSMYDLKPGTVGWRVIHEEAVKNSSQVWLENANGLSLVREHGRDVHKSVAPEVITWLKLICRDVETF